MNSLPEYWKIKTSGEKLSEVVKYLNSNFKANLCGDSPEAYYGKLKEYEFCSQNPPEYCQEITFEEFKEATSKRKKKTEKPDNLNYLESFLKKLEVK